MTSWVDWEWIGADPLAAPLQHCAGFCAPVAEMCRFVSGYRFRFVRTVRIEKRGFSAIYSPIGE
jgi:hypothetical protein